MEKVFTMSELSKNIIVKVTIKEDSKFKIRKWIGMRLLILSGKILPYEFKITKEKQLKIS